MEKNLDKNYNYNKQLEDIIEMSEALQGKIFDLQSECLTIDENIRHYDLLKSDLSHIREALVMKPHLGSKLSTHEKKILARRREIKDARVALKDYKMLDKMSELSLIAQELGSTHKKYLKAMDKRKYTMRTEIGNEILESLVKEGVRYSLGFNPIIEAEDIVEKHLTKEIVDDVENVVLPAPTSKTKEEKEVEPIAKKAPVAMYSLEKDKKIWVLKDPSNIKLCSHRKMSEVIGFMMKSHIDIKRVDIKDHKHSFDAFYQKTLMQAVK